MSDLREVLERMAMESHPEWDILSVSEKKQVMFDVQRVLRELTGDREYSNRPEAIGYDVLGIVELDL